MRFLRFLALLSLLTFSASSLMAQETAVRVPPDRGYIQGGAYHSVFFGFSYKLPEGWTASTTKQEAEGKPADPNTPAPESFLVEASDATTHANLRITAIDLLFTPQIDGAEMFLDLVQAQVEKNVKGVEKTGQVKRDVGARALVTRYLKTTVGEHAVHQALSVMLEKKYALVFLTSAADAEIVRKFDVIPALTFAATPAPSAAPSVPAGAAKPEDGDITENKYANPFFGFTVQFPADWVVHGKEAAARITNTVEKMASSGDDPEAMQESLQRTRFLFVALPKSGGAAIMAFSEDLLTLQLETANQYLEILLHGALGPEAKWLKAPEEITLGGKKFIRASYVQVAQGASITHTTYVTMERKFALGFDTMYFLPQHAESGAKVLQSVAFSSPPKGAK